MGTKSSNDNLLAESLSPSRCIERCSKGAATPVFSGKVYSNSTGEFESMFIL